MACSSMSSTGGVMTRPFTVRLLPISAPRPSLSICLANTSRKGFGPASTSDSNDIEARKARLLNRVNTRREQTPIPNQGQVSNALKDVARLEDKLKQVKEDVAFAQRLSALRQEVQDRRREVQVASGASSNASAPPASSAAFDAAPAKDVYANPPTLKATLMSQLNADVSDPALKTAEIGPSQVGIAVSAVMFGLVFVLVSGADFAPETKRYQGVVPTIVPPDMTPPDEFEEAIIKTKIAELEIEREMEPTDTAALEELAVSYAQLFEFGKAADLLDQLVAAKPNDAEAWRLLGETTLLSQQPARSVAAYEKAVSLNKGDLQVLTGLVDAYIANAQQSKAIDYLVRLKGPAPPAATEATDGADGQAAAAAPAPPTEFSISLDLLLAKVYSGWRGHDSNALATYDSLIASAPEDFRGYLAKGLFLKERGQQADAQRMFMQARFHAPEGRQALVDQLAGANPVLDLPGSD